jgi:uncharacterized protein YhbP (UPF0306 family)
MTADTNRETIDDPSALRSQAEAIIDANEYMTLATAGEDGIPWASPVWYASDDHREFLWMSKPGARHSRNIAVRAEIAIAIFDSRQPPNTGQGVYIAAIAEQVPESELAGAVATFSRISTENGALSVSCTDVEAPARHRLYRAVARERFVLSSSDERSSVET